MQIKISSKQEFPNGSILYLSAQENNIVLTREDLRKLIHTEVETDQGERYMVVAVSHYEGVTTILDNIEIQGQRIQ